MWVTARDDGGVKNMNNAVSLLQDFKEAAVILGKEEQQLSINV